MGRVLFVLAVAATVLQFVPSASTQNEFEYEVLPPVYNVGNPPATPVYYPPPETLDPSPSPKPQTPSPSTRPPPPPTHKPPPPPPPKPSTLPTLKPSLILTPTPPPTKRPATHLPSKTRPRRPHTTPNRSPSPPKKRLPASSTQPPVRKHRPKIARKPAAGPVHKPVNNEEYNHYSFKYDVDEDGAQYTHSEVSDGQEVSGFFSLRLPNSHHHDFTYVAG